MSEYEDIRRQLQVISEGDSQTKVTIPGSDLETIAIPDIAQEVKPIENHSKYGYLCRCGSPTCVYTVMANEMADRGEPDYHIRMFLQTVN